jgi:hypothetical protein
MRDIACWVLFLRENIAIKDQSSEAG